LTDLKILKHEGTAQENMIMMAMNGNSKADAAIADRAKKGVCLMATLSTGIPRQY
jgi:hypothetical protein